ncbi:MAG: hypothetical protein JWP34_5050, partial [Massilia sp.]|nr:hypothetical protein [Massilia sp.]
TIAFRFLVPGGRLALRTAKSEGENTARGTLVSNKPRLGSTREGIEQQTERKCRRRRLRVLARISECAE